MEINETKDRRWWTDPAWLLALALPLLAWRVLGDAGGAVLGHPLGEQYDGLWIQWLFNGALEQGRLPYHFPGVLADQDLRFYPIDPSTLLVRWGLSRVMGTVAAYNVTAVALVGLLAGATVLLARELGLGRWSAALAGLVAMLHPGFLGYLADGRSESCVTGWSVLVFWAALRLARRPGAGAAVLLAVLIAAMALAGPNHWLATMALLLAPAAVLLARGSWRLRRLTALALGLAALLCLPVLHGIWQGEIKQGRRTSWARSDAPALVELVPAAEAEKRLALWHLADGLTRTPKTSRWTRISDRQLDTNEQTRRSLATLPPHTISAPGARRFVWISATLLGLLGLIRRPRRVWPWMVGAVGLAVLAHGNGCANAPLINLPFSEQYLVVRPAVLLRWIPHFLNYGILASMGAVALGVAAGHGLASLPWPRPRLLGAAALLVCALEAQLAGPTPLPLPATRVSPPGAVVRALRADPKAIVATFPCDSRQLLLQTWHGNPVLYRWGFMAGGEESGLAGLQRMVDDGLVDEQLIHQLRGRRARAVVVFHRLMAPDKLHSLLLTLRMNARRVVKDDEVTLFFL